MKKKVQLVLGSGGARGIAHIGVIDRLIEDGYEIIEVYGCSMGAVIGGMYCAGFLPQYRDWLIRQTKSDIYGLFDITLSMQGFIKGERIFGVLEQITGKQQIENLNIPFMAVATDMLSRREVHFTSGDLRGLSLGRASALIEISLRGGGKRNNFPRVCDDCSSLAFEIFSTPLTRPLGNVERISSCFFVRPRLQPRCTEFSRPSCEAQE